MQPDERDIWNRKYREAFQEPQKPDAFFLQAYDELLEPAPPGRALDVAGGLGRHALWLAERGWRVTLVDISDVAMERVRTQDDARGTLSKIETKVVDLTSPSVTAGIELGREGYDLILVFLYLQRDLFPALIEALKPGGLLLYKTYTAEGLNIGSVRGPHNPKYLLAPDELRQAFRELEILQYREEGGVAEMIAKRP
ncbi:MAG TPA: methyltransferase domain-containing protein [Candidatus Angelobacter sp.]|nr:methyltransferase domain-containing protein [Candidatus Angelobacter sp.]